MAEGKIGEHLVTFTSGNYKKVTGAWKGDSVWMHFIKTHSGMVHVNKDVGGACGKLRCAGGASDPQDSLPRDRGDDHGGPEGDHTPGVFPEPQIDAEDCQGVAP